MVKYSQTICWLLPTNCLSVFDHFVGFALKGLGLLHSNILGLMIQITSNFALALRSKQSLSDLLNLWKNSLVQENTVTLLSPKVNTS